MRLDISTNSCSTTSAQQPIHISQQTNRPKQAELANKAVNLEKNHKFEEINAVKQDILNSCLSKTKIKSLNKISSVIKSSDSIVKLHEIINNIKNKEDILLLSDLDLTLIKPLDHIGSPLLFDWNLKKTMECKKLSKQEAISYLSPLNAWLDANARSLPVEAETTKKTVESLKGRVKFLGCTARRFGVAEQVFKQLEIAQISLERQNDQDLTLLEINGRIEAAYRKGVIFTGSTYSKGEIVQKFLATEKHNYSHIILIDDLKENLVEMAKRVDEIGLNFIGLHYTAFDAVALTDEEAINTLEPIINKYPEFSQYSYLLEK